MSATPRLLCIGGMHGHGHYALRSLLDGHPDIVAYPFFLANLFRYWRYGSLSKCKADKILGRIWDLVSDDPIFEASIGVTKEDIGFNEVAMKNALAKEFQQFDPRKPISLISVIKSLLRAYHLTSSFNKNIHPKYYAFEVDCREIPWECPSFLNEVSHLFTIRDPYRSYLSHRADYLDRHGWGLPKFLFFRAPLELSQAIYNWRVLWKNFRRSDFLIFPFENMRSSPEETMRNISKSLGIPYHKTLISLTRNGIPEYGFTTDGNNKSNQIAAKGGNYLIPLTKSEELILKFVPIFDVFDSKSMPKEINSINASMIMQFWSESIKLPIFILSPFWKLDIADFRLFNQWQLLKNYRTFGLSKNDAAEYAKEYCRSSVVRLTLLRGLAFIGFNYLLLVARVFGGKFLLWPHLIILIRLNLYHRLEKIFKKKVGIRIGRFESEMPKINKGI